MRKNSIVSINSQYRENNDENNNKNNDENVSACKRGYTKNGIYNCKRGASIANNFICVVNISIISKSEKEDDNVSVVIRGYSISIVYNCKRESSIESINKRKRESNNKIIDV